MTTPDAPIARLKEMAKKATRPQFMVDSGVDYSVRWTREQQGQAVAFQMARQQLRSAMEEFGPDLLAAVEAAYGIAANAQPIRATSLTEIARDESGKVVGWVVSCDVIEANRRALDKLHRPAGGEEAGGG